MRHRIAALTAAILALASTASATTVTIQFTSADSHDSVYGGYYAGIYHGTVNGQSATFISDDFLTDISNNQSWQAYANSNSPVSSGPTGVKYTSSGGTYNMSNADLTTGDKDSDFIGSVASPQEEYNMVTWLVEQIFKDPKNSKEDWGAYAGAIWSITDGGWKPSDYENKVFGTGVNALTAESAVALAYGHRDDTNLPKYHVYTPTDFSKGQEFYSAAEPDTALLLILTLISIGGWALKQWLLSGSSSCS